MKHLILAAVLISTTASFAGTVEADKLRMLSKVFADPSIHSRILKDGYDFVSLRFELADDAGTEPVYYLGTMNPKATPTFKCYSVFFDTDEPAVAANVREVEADEVRFCQ